MPDSLSEHQAELARFGRTSLGPACAALLGRAEIQSLVVERMRAGRPLEDAALSVVHERAREDRALADEFLAYFLQDLMLQGHHALSPELRRFLDTGDLVQSVLGDLWSQLARVEFPSRAGFIALLAQRLQWKASDRARALKRDKRREDRREGESVEDLELASDAPSISSGLRGEEDAEWLALQLLKLSERDRQILRLHLAGATTDAVAGELCIAAEAARRAIHRALGRARDLARPRREP